MSNGAVICVAGSTGEGKSTFVKQKFTSKHKRETLLYLTVRSDFEGAKVKKFTNFGELIKVARNKQNIVVIVDEAFTCLPEKLNIKMDKPDYIHNQFAEVLVNARKLNVLFIFLVHSLDQIPKWLVRYLNWLIRFNTLDQFEYQEQRFKSFPIIVNSLKNKRSLPKFKPDILKLR